MPQCSFVPEGLRSVGPYLQDQLGGVGADVGAAVGKAVSLLFLPFFVESA